MKLIVFGDPNFKKQMDNTNFNIYQYMIEESYVSTPSMGHNTFLSDLYKRTK